MDQNHEQLNDYLKKGGGIVGLTEDPVALKRFLVCAPLLTALCSDFEMAFPKKNKSIDNKHHAEADYLQMRFLKDISSLFDSILSQGNPFNPNQKEIINIYTHEQSLSSALVYDIEAKADSLFEDYLQDVFIDGSQAIYVEIKENDVTFFNTKNVSKNKNKEKIKSAQTCNKIVTNLFIASQQRDADLDELFKHEISLPPPALYSAAEINICKTKSQLMDCMINSDDIVFPTTVDCSAILLDGSSIAQSHTPKGVKSIGEYIEKTFIHLINKYLSNYSRVDLLFDRYFENSIKNVTRNARGDGGRFHIVPTTPIPRNWKKFMQNSENKRELFRLIAKYVESTINPSEGKQVICTMDQPLQSRRSGHLHHFTSKRCSCARIFIHTLESHGH